MKKLILLMLLAFSAPLANAATAPNFDLARWSKLMNRMILEGSRTDSTYGTMLSLSKVNPPDESKSRQAEYISVLGTYSDNIFMPLMVSAVSETWTLLDNGNWDIDQRIYNTQPMGDLSKVLHLHIVKSSDTNTVLTYDHLPVGEIYSVEELTNWGKKLNEWY